MLAHLLGSDRVRPILCLICVCGSTTSASAQSQIFVDETPLRMPALEDRSSDGAFGDLDVDGDLDIVISTTASSVHRPYLLVNVNSGYFPIDSLTSLLPFAFTFNSVAAADFQMDGGYATPLL